MASNGTYLLFFKFLIYFSITERKREPPVVSWCHDAALASPSLGSRMHLEYSGRSLDRNPEPSHASLTECHVSPLYHCLASSPFIISGSVSQKSGKGMVGWILCSESVKAKMLAGCLFSGTWSHLPSSHACDRMWFFAAVGLTALLICRPLARSLLVETTCHFLPSGPVHLMAVCSFKPNRSTSAALLFSVPCYL